jgi:hypothetical protein
VAESCVIDGTQHEATAEDAAKLAEYVRGKLGLAVSLACQGEQERRSGPPYSQYRNPRAARPAASRRRPGVPGRFQDMSILEHENGAVALKSQTPCF